MKRRWKRMAALAAVMLLGVAGAWAANDPDARFKGGTHHGYDEDVLLVSQNGALAGRTKGGTHDGYSVFVAAGVKQQAPAGTLIMLR